MGVPQLTGRKRHRAENGKLILQIEEQDYTAHGSSIGTVTPPIWRDATVEDVTLESKGPGDQAP